MTVKIRNYKRGGFEVDITFTWPDGARFRERRRSPVTGRSASKRWGEARESELLRAGKAALTPPPPEKEVPTVSAFWPKFIDEFCRANRQKESGIESKETVYRVHLRERVGSKKLDEITKQDVQAIKADLIDKSPKTVNNVLSALSKMLKVAVEWETIDDMPCRITLLKVGLPVPKFYEFDQYVRLVDAGLKLGPRIHLMILLGGDAGLRRGEIIALRPCDVDFRRRQLVIEKSIVRGREGTPKSGRGRIIPMTDALYDALYAHRHLKGRILLDDDGEILTPRILRRWMEKAQRRAGLEEAGSLHILRHTFCSHLSMRGAPARSIQDLAGHANLSTTLRYMHLSPGAKHDAIKLLNAARAEQVLGDMLETGSKNAASG